MLPFEVNISVTLIDKSSFIMHARSKNNIVLPFILLVISLSIFAIALIWQINRWSIAMHKLVEDSNYQLELVYIMDSSVSSRAFIIYHMLLTDDIFLRDQYFMQYMEHSVHYIDARTKILHLTKNKEVLQNIALLDQIVREFQPLSDELVYSLRDNITITPKRQKALHKMQQLHTQIFKQLDTLISLQRRVTRESSLSYANMQNNLWITAFIGFSVILLLGVFFARGLSLRYYQLEKMTVVDELTQIPNRRYMDDILNVEWYRCMRQQSPLSVLLVDIDYFKDFNDKFGHQAGDQCLISIAQILDDNLKRASDFVARYGGEEFIVVLPHTTQNDAQRIAEGLVTSVREEHIPAGNDSVSPWVTVSAGLASIIPNETDNVLQLIKAADRKLYKAKHKGRNQLVI